MTDFSFFRYLGYYSLEDRLLIFRPDFYQILEDLDWLRNVGSWRLTCTKVHHEYRGKANGQVLGVHFVSWRLSRHFRQMIHYVNQTILERSQDFTTLIELKLTFIWKKEKKIIVYYRLKKIFSLLQIQKKTFTLLALGRQSRMEKTSLAFPSGSSGRKTPMASTNIW